jgi:ATP-binding cassette subfamily B protein
MNEAHSTKLPLKDIFRFIWFIVRGHKSMLYGMMACAILFSAIEVVLPVVGKALFEGMEAAQLSSVIQPNQVWQMAALFFALNIVFWLFRYGMFYVWIPFAAKYMSHVVEQAFARVQLFSTAWHSNTFSGVTVRNITRGISAIDGILNITVTQFFPTFCVIIGAAFYMAISGHPFMAFILFLFLVLFTASTGYISLKIVSKFNRRANEMDSHIGGLVADAITCNAAVKAFGAEGHECDRLNRGLDDWQKHSMRAWYASTNNGVLQTVLNVGMRAGFVLMALYQWSLGKATMGDVYFAFSITAIIGAYLKDFGMNLRMLQNHINDLEPVAAYMYMQPAIQDLKGARPLTVTRGGIRFENVTFGYKPDKSPLFQGLSVDIPAGKTVALVGRSGSGKTSFVKLLQRLHDIQYGQITIDDQNIADVTQQSLHHAIALVPQDPVLFHRTLAENIAYARPDVGMDVIRAAARDAFIDDFIMSLPEGYNTLVGERGIKLSGGERQRVAIARAIVANRPVLVMDEATSALDSLSENLVQSALETLLKNRTTLIIAHRLSTIRRADLILVFEEGRVVEQGTHDALLAQNGTYKQLYDAQAGGFIV